MLQVGLIHTSAPWWAHLYNDNSDFTGLPSISEITPYQMVTTMLIETQQNQKSSGKSKAAFTGKILQN